jgi:uncharacterized integral membrane protein
MKGLKFVFALLAMLILLVAAWQNIPPILEKSITLRLNLHWMQWETDPIPLYLIVPICFLAGFGVMWILDFSTRMRLRREVRKLEKELRSLRTQAGYGSPASLDSYADEPLEEERESLAPGEAVSR